jgi:glutamine synthetase adenylyltransferase
MNISAYRSIAEDWERRATIRTRPRRLLENDDKLIYPLCRQPLVLSATSCCCKASTNSSMTW